MGCSSCATRSILLEMLFRFLEDGQQPLFQLALRGLHLLIIESTVREIRLTDGNAYFCEREWDHELVPCLENASRLRSVGDRHDRLAGDLRSEDCAWLHL